MPSYYYASIAIGGNTRQRDVRGLERAAERDGVGADDWSGVADNELVTTNELEVEGGDFPSLRAFCNENGLAYDLVSEGATVSYRPGHKRYGKLDRDGLPPAVHGDGEPMVPIKRVLAALDTAKGDGIERRVRELCERYTCPQLKPLRIVADKPARARELEATR
jgi:hypothetical protein